MTDIVKHTGIIDIPILNTNCIIDNICSIIEKHVNSKIFNVSSLTWKDYEEQIKNNITYKNVLFDIATEYDDNNTLYRFIDFFKNLGSYSMGIKKHIISLMDYYIWDKEFDIVNIKSLKKEFIVDGISFDIIRKENK